MGTICSCTRSDQAHNIMWLKGRSSSFADVYLTGRKLDIRVAENGEVSTLSPNCRGYPVPLEYAIADCTIANEHFGICGSRNSLDESGIESNGFSSMSTIESTRSAALSAPATPYSIRQKPPPKPPRMRQYSYDGGANTLPTRAAMLSSQSSNTCPDSPGAHSAGSSFLDISTFDMSFSSTHEVQPVSRIYPTNSTDKVYNILMQTKDFLIHEIDVDIIIPSLLEKRVLNTMEVSELGRIKDRTLRCELLLDLLMNKSHPEFLLFCDTLKNRTRCPNLADLLLALDSLIDLGSEDSVKKRMSVSSDFSNEFDIESLKNCTTCEQQKGKDSDDYLTDTTNFDVEILYIDKTTGHTKSLKDISEIKKEKLASAARSHVTVSELIKHEADKYIPVISASLYNYCLWSVGMDKITKAIGKKTCIRELSLSKCHLGTHSIRRLSQALYKTGVYKLDLRLNNLSDDGFLELADGLKRNTTVKVLNLSSTNLSASNCKVLLQGICRNQSTHELDIGFNDLQDNGCDVIAEALTTNCPLRKLRIRDNGIGADGAYRLFKALKKNSRLVLLDISSNTIGHISLTTMSEMLRYNRTLKQLNIENCEISKDGCQSIARALKSNTVLRSLDMSRNRFGDAGVEALSEGLKYNQVLDILSLNMCEINNYGFAKLLEALRYNMSLKTLKMCYNKIGRNCDGYCTPASNSSTVDLNNTTSTASDVTLNASHVTLNDVASASTKDLSPTASIEEIYDKLCQVLQQNKDLKVLLWGNKLDEEICKDGHGDQSELERAIVHVEDSSSLDKLNASIVSEHPAHSDEPNSSDNDVFDNTDTNQNSTSLPIGNANTSEQKTSRLNSLQRNFVQQYTINHGHPSNGNTSNVSHADAKDQLNISVNENNGVSTHSRVQISPRMGTCVTPSVPALNASHNALNTSCGSTNTNTHMDNTLLTIPNCNGQLGNNLHHPRIRTNGSLPRKPKRLHANGVNNAVNGESTITSNSSGDVFMPHTIPKRGGKSTLIN